MTVWTISAQEGAGGDEVAAELAAAAGVTLVDAAALVRLAQESDPQIPELDELMERVGGRINALALSVAMATGAADAFRELQLRQTLPELGRALLTQAGRSPCVIASSVAATVLADHPGAVHVRLRAPLEWRIAAYQREHLVDRRCAEKAVKHRDHLLHGWVRSLFHVDVDELRRYSLLVDASRFSRPRLVELLLAAGGRRPPTT